MRTLLVLLIVFGCFSIPREAKAQVNPLCTAPLEAFTVVVDKVIAHLGEQVTFTVASTFTGSSDGAVGRMVVLPAGVAPLTNYDMDSQRLISPWSNQYTRTVVKAQNLEVFVVFRYRAEDRSICEVAKRAWVFVPPFFD